uniref:Uncharacterized protein n=1 Tax=Panagrolaimus sp. ES5 TaxID=591445 RepID=A0AC34FIQ9_9BILA
MISKIYKCDATTLVLENLEITFDEFLLLSNSAIIVFLRNVSIKYENGDEVQLEKLVQNCLNAKIFDFTFSSNPTNISSKTVKKLVKITHFSTMKKIVFKEVPEVFDIKTLFAFLKKKNLNIELEFCETLSEEYRCLLKFLENKLSFIESNVVLERI